MIKYIKTDIYNEDKKLLCENGFEYHVDYVVDMKDFSLIPSPKKLTLELMDILKGRGHDCVFQAEGLLVDLLRKLGYDEAMDIYEQIGEECL